MSTGFGAAWGTPYAGGDGAGVTAVSVGDAVVLGATPTAAWYRAVADALHLDAAAAAFPGIGISDTIHFHASAQASGLLLQAVNTNVGLQDAALLAWDMAVSDALQLVDSAETLRTLLQVAADRLRLIDAASTQWHALAAVIAGVALADRANPVYAMEAADAVAFADTALAIGTLLASAADSFAVSDGAAGSLRLVVALEDTLALDAAAVTQLTALQAVFDGLRVGMTIRIAETDYFAYVLHTQPVDKSGTRPVTQYRNFPFNSFASFEGVDFAAGPGGIYQLGGSDDAGAPIEAWIRSGLTSFGTSSEKRLPDMFIVFREGDDTSAFLKVVTASKAGRFEDWFKLEAVPSTAEMASTRAKIAQGLKSVFWQYELRNIAGAPFALEELRFFPVVLEGH